MFLATHLIGFGAGGSAGARTYVGEAPAIKTGSVSSFTFTNFDTGAAGSLLVICVRTARVGSSFAISSLTVNGVGATINVQTYGNNASVDAECSAICSIVSPGGLQSVVVNYASSAFTNCDINAYNLSGISSNTPFHTAGGGAGASPSTSCSLNVPDNGIIIATTCSNQNETTTMSGVTVDRSAATSGVGWATGSLQGLSAETGRTISGSGAAGVRSIVAASWA